ncbi:MAG: hypothetical protein HY318_02065 [Armatimonadetes bacterium]|nr:hypothetical protein [Armatimonadota bacterium]
MDLSNRRIPSFLGITCCLLVVSSCVISCGAQTTGRVYLFLLDRVTWGDLEAQRREGGAFEWLIENGAIAALNTKTADGTSTMRAAITLSAGMEANGDEDAGEAYNVDELVDLESGRGGEVFQRRTGVSPGSARVLATKTGAIRQRNLAFQGRSRLGELGELLRQRGLMTAALGCSDLSPLGKTLWEYKFPGVVTQFGSIVRHRPAALVAMDATGKTRYGDVGRSVLEPDPTAPFGWRSSSSAILSRLDGCRLNADLFLTVIDWGDTFRADEYSLWSELAVTNSHRTKALGRADRFLGDLLTRLRPGQDTLLLLSLSPPHSAPCDLCPLIVYGRGFRGDGVLTSASTRTSGVVTLGDLTASILQLAEIERPRFLQGSLLRVSRTKRPWEQVGGIVQQCATVDGHLRIPMLAVLSLLETAILVWAFLCLWRSSPEASEVGLPQSESVRGGTRVEIALLSLLAFPLLLFWSTPLLLHCQSFLEGAFLLMAASTIVGFTAHRCCRNRWLAVSLVGAVTALSISFDLLTGSHISFNAVLGYSPFIGARYYGLGNECMAVLMGAALMTAGALLSVHGSRQASVPVTNVKFLFVGGGLFLCLILIGLPRLGSDFGGTVGAAVGFGAALYRLKGLLLSRERWLLILLGIVLLLSFYTWMDLRDLSELSHLGRLVLEVRDHGLVTLWLMVWRKLEILGRSFRHPHWDLGLLTTLVIVCLLPELRSWRRLPVLDRYPAFVACLYGLLMGAIASFLINDSGPVMPVLSALYGLASLMYVNHERPAILVTVENTPFV